jgi:hypothetical protein
MTEPEAATRAVISRHREVLVASALVLVLSQAMVVRPDDRIAARGYPGLALPPTCISQGLLGVKCPGCGLTRSLVHLAHGDPRASWREHRLGGLLAAVILLQIPYRLLALRRPEQPIVPGRLQNLLSYGLIVLLLGNWLIEQVADVSVRSSLHLK